MNGQAGRARPQANAQCAALSSSSAQDFLNRSHEAMKILPELLLIGGGAAALLIVIQLRRIDKALAAIDSSARDIRRAASLSLSAEQGIVRQPAEGNRRS